MNLDELAREASSDLKLAAANAPFVSIETIRRRRLTLIAAPVAAAAVLWVVTAVVVSPPPPTTPPVATPTTEQTTTTTEVEATTTTPPTTIGVSTPWIEDGTSWIRGGVSDVVDDTGSTIAEVDFTAIGLLGGARGSAWDGDGGFVVVTEDGILWYRNGEIETVELPGVVAGNPVPIVEVVAVDGTHVIGLGSFDNPAVAWFDLTTGEPAEAPEGARTLDGARSDNTFQAQGRTAVLEFPDWSDVERAEDGMPIAPFDLPNLVVTENGNEILRFEVGSEQRPYAHLHDFDGRRVIVSAEPHEPALAPRTVWIIDLECAACTEVVETSGPEWFDLVGTLGSEGDVQVPELG